MSKLQKNNCFKYKVYLIFVFMITGGPNCIFYHQKPKIYNLGYGILILVTVYSEIALRHFNHLNVNISGTFLPCPSERRTGMKKQVRL